MKILFVEGSQDKNFVEELLKRQKINYGDNFEIKNCTNLGKVFKEFQLAIKTENYSQIGIIIDAYQTIDQYCNNLNTILKAESIITLPKNPTEKGNYH